MRVRQGLGGDINGDGLKNDRGLADAIAFGQLMSDGNQQHKIKKLGQHCSDQPERFHIQQRDSRDIDIQDRQDIGQQDDAGHQDDIGNDGDEGRGVGRQNSIKGAFHGGRLAWVIAPPRKGENACWAWLCGD